MNYTIHDIDKIIDFKTWSAQEKIDELLRIDCKQYTNLGIDSTKTEKESTKRNSRRIYRLIKSVDKDMGESFLIDI
jgi:hypothetical protein